MLVRTLSADDVPELGWIAAWASFPSRAIPDDAVTHPRVRRWLERWEDELGVGAEQNGQLIGAAWARVTEPSASAASYPEVIIGVQPEHRAVKVGTALIRSLIELAIQRGLNGLCLAVGRQNLAAVRLYGRAGFRTMESSTEERLVMVLDLNEEQRPSASAAVMLAPMGVAEAGAVARWRYPPPYDLYDGSEAEIAVMLDPANGYQAVHVGGEFVGFVCAGPDARVGGQFHVDGVQDIGWGFRPDLVGRRLASTWAVRAVETLTRHTSAHQQRVVIAAWNERSLAVARRLRFAQPTPHINEAGHWTILTRPLGMNEGPSRGERR